MNIFLVSKVWFFHGGDGLGGLLCLYILYMGWLLEFGFELAISFFLISLMVPYFLWIWERWFILYCDLVQLVDSSVSANAFVCADYYWDKVLYYMVLFNYDGDMDLDWFCSVL